MTETTTSQGGSVAVISERDLHKLLARHVPAFADIASEAQYEQHATPAVSLARSANALFQPSAEQRDMQDRAQAQGEAAAVVEAPPWASSIMSGIESCKTALETKLVPMAGKVNELDDKMTGIDDKMAGIDDKMACFDDKMMSIDDEVRAQGHDLEHVMARLQEIENRNTALESRNAELHNELEEVKRASYSQPPPSPPQPEPQPPQPQSPQPAGPLASALNAAASRKSVRAHNINGRVYYRIGNLRKWKRRRSNAGFGIYQNNINGRYTVRDFAREQHVLRLQQKDEGNARIAFESTNNKFMLKSSFLLLEDATDARNESLRQIGLEYESKTQQGVSLERLVGI